jgi:hypothetical protein
MLTKKITAIYCIVLLAVICLKKSENFHQNYCSCVAQIHHEPNSLEQTKKTREKHKRDFS